MPRSCVGHLEHEVAFQPFVALVDEAIVRQRTPEPPGEVLAISHVADPSVVAQPVEQLAHRIESWLAFDRDRTTAELGVEVAERGSLVAREQPRMFGEAPQEAGSAQPRTELCCKRIMPEADGLQETGALPSHGQGCDDSDLAAAQVEHAPVATLGKVLEGGAHDQTHQ